MPPRLHQLPEEEDTGLTNFEATTRMLATTSIQAQGVTATAGPQVVRPEETQKMPRYPGLAPEPRPELTRARSFRGSGVDLSVILAIRTAIKDRVLKLGLHERNERRMSDHEVCSNVKR